MLISQSVGVSGHVLHGGFGMASNTHGLALDWVIGITVVLANATVVECSESQNSDLFWAMLGAGSNFGIVASYQFKTFEAPANVTWFSAQLPWNQSTAQAGLEALESYAKNTMPAELNMRLAGSSRSASVEGVYYGDEEGLEAALEPLLNKTGGSISDARMDRTTAQNAYWGVSLPRLQEIKVQVDPTELFYYPISIEPATVPGPAYAH